MRVSISSSSSCSLLLLLLSSQTSAFAPRPSLTVLGRTSVTKLALVLSDASTPDAAGLPEVSLPEVSVPEVSLPEVSLPEVSLPDVSLPDFDLSALSMTDPIVLGAGAALLLLTSAFFVGNTDSSSPSSSSSSSSSSSPAPTPESSSTAVASATSEESLEEVEVTEPEADKADVFIPYDAASLLAYDEWRKDNDKGDYDEDTYQKFKPIYEAMAIALVVSKKSQRDIARCEQALSKL